MKSDQTMGRIWAPILLLVLATGLIFGAFASMSNESGLQVDWLISAAIAGSIGFVWLVVALISRLRADYDGHKGSNAPRPHDKVRVDKNSAWKRRDDTTYQFKKNMKFRKYFIIGFMIYMLLRLDLPIPAEIRISIFAIVIFVGILFVFRLKDEELKK